jgi:hypothetical protein
MSTSTCLGGMDTVKVDVGFGTAGPILGPGGSSDPTLW